MLSALAGELGKLPNTIAMEGHTDSKPYSAASTYTNWELSSDRANAARRLMLLHGIRTDQVTQVRGFADQRLRKKENPLDPSNRRISLIVQYLPKKPGESDAKSEKPGEGEAKESKPGSAESKSEKPESQTRRKKIAHTRSALGAAPSGFRGCGFRLNLRKINTTTSTTLFFSPIQRPQHRHVRAQHCCAPSPQDPSASLGLLKIETEAKIHKNPPDVHRLS